MVQLHSATSPIGHTSVHEMTLRYAHIAPEQKESAVALLDKVMLEEVSLPSETVDLM